MYRHPNHTTRIKQLGLKNKDRILLQKGKSGAVLAIKRGGKPILVADLAMLIVSDTTIDEVVQTIAARHHATILRTQDVNKWQQYVVWADTT